MPTYPMPATYATLDEANQYFAWNFGSDAWNDACDDDRCRALVSATRAIDRLNFAGLRTSDWNRQRATVTLTGQICMPQILAPSSVYPPPGQPLEFPRNGWTAIPQDIQFAACEIALALLDGVDPEMEMQGIGTNAVSLAGARVSFDPAIARLAYRHGIASYKAWVLIYPYLADPSELVLRRIN